MKVIVADSAGNTLKTKSIGKVFVDVSEYFSGGDDDEEERIEVESIFSYLIGAEKNYRLSFPIGTTIPQIINRTPHVCTVNGIDVIREGDGLGELDLIIDGSTSKLFLYFTTNNANPARVFIDWVEGTQSRYLADQIRGFAAAAPTPDKNLFTTVNHATSVYTLNASRWITVDLSFIAVANNHAGFWTRERGATLITAQHVLMVEHYPVSVGKQLRFRDPSGVIHTRTIVGSTPQAWYNRGGWDVVIATLDSPLVTIDPVRLVGEWIRILNEPVTDGAAAGYQWALYVGGLGFFVDRHAKIHAVILGDQIANYALGVTLEYNGLVFDRINTASIGATPYYPILPVDNHINPIYYKQIQTDPPEGDSGSPCFVIVDGEPLLIHAMVSTFAGSAIFMNGVANAMIADSDADAIARGALTSPTGYTVSVAPAPAL